MTDQIYPLPHPDTQPHLESMDKDLAVQIFTHIMTQKGPLDTRRNLPNQYAPLGHNPTTDDTQHVIPGRPELGNLVQRLNDNSDLADYYSRRGDDSFGGQYLHQLLSEFMRRRTGV